MKFILLITRTAWLKKKKTSAPLVSAWTWRLKFVPGSWRCEEKEQCKPSMKAKMKDATQLHYGNCRTQCFLELDQCQGRMARMSLPLLPQLYFKSSLKLKVNRMMFYPTRKRLNFYKPVLHQIAGVLKTFSKYYSAILVFCWVQRSIFRTNQLVES